MCCMSLSSSRATASGATSHALIAGQKEVTPSSGSRKHTRSSATAARSTPPIQVGTIQVVKPNQLVLDWIVIEEPRGQRIAAQALATIEDVRLHRV